MQKRKGVVLAAPKSGSGKTLITCALIEALKEAGVNVCAFKCGPDYIDPMFHRTILGVPGGNLDTYFTGEAKTKEIFMEETPEDAFAKKMTPMKVNSALPSQEMRHFVFIIRRT